MTQRGRPASATRSTRSTAPFRLINHTGYDTGDLRRFVARGLSACGVRTRGLVVECFAAPGRSKGCADIGGRFLSLAVAPPSKAAMSRLALVLEHEAAHLRGLQHEQMSAALHDSRGPVPRWAQGLRIRYLGRAPNQLPLRRGITRA